MAHPPPRPPTQRFSPVRSPPPPPPRLSSHRAAHPNRASATAVGWCSLVTSWPSTRTLGALHFRRSYWEPGFSQDVAGCRRGRWSPRRGRRRGGPEGLHRRRLQPCGEQRLVGSLRPRGLRRPERRRPLLAPGLPPRSLRFYFLQFLLLSKYLTCSFGFIRPHSCSCEQRGEIVTTLPGHKAPVNCTLWLPTKKDVLHGASVFVHFFL